MADQADTVAPTSFARSGRFRLILGAVALVAIGIGLWFWLTRGYESTDDAQVDAHVTQIAARVSGPVLSVKVQDNQVVDAGTVLVEIDPRDYQVAVEKARAELAEAEAGAVAARSSVPISSATSTGDVSTARGTVEQARSSSDVADKEIDAAKARLSAAQARLREAEANATRTARDVERLKGLLAKDEVAQQQYDATVANAAGMSAATDTARAQIAEAEAGIRMAESRRSQAKVGEQQAATSLRTAQTGPNMVAATRARAASAEANVAQKKATLAQAELNLEYTVVKAPARGIVSKKTINPGQVVQAGQPLIALVQHEDVWITANFKETQLGEMKAGQRAVIEVDAYDGKKFNGHVDSLSAATGARFSLLPPENATGNFVKVVQRIPVKIVLEPNQDPDHLLRPGMSVTPTVYMK